MPILSKTYINFHYINTHFDLCSQEYFAGLLQYYCQNRKRNCNYGQLPTCLIKLLY